MAVYTKTVEDRELLLRLRLAGRVQALTGRVLAKEEIAVDCAIWRAMAMVDGVIFHLGERELTVLRPCAHCETGCFKSLPIVSQSDLGYVLAAWQPYHDDCQPTDAPDDVSW